jgi:hypothetical protein
MKTSTRILGSLALLASALPMIAWVQPACLSAIGLEWQSKGKRAAWAQRSKDQDAHYLVVRQRLMAKDKVIKRLLAGEMSLVEAAAWFGFLNETPAKYPDLRWRSIPGSSDGEKLCRQVILWVNGARDSQALSSPLDNRLCQLEEELAGHLARHGTIDLTGKAPSPF